MKTVLLTLFAVAILASCEKDETIAGFIAPGQVWHVVSVDDRPFEANTSIEFLSDGVVRGKAPCNNFTAKQTVPYPWLAIENIAATKTSCPKIKAEQVLFERLSLATLVEVQGRSMILSNDDGILMELEAR